MTLSKYEAVTFFGILFGGEHHIPGTVKQYGNGWSVITRQELSTYDFDLLTRLVLLSHETCIRSCILQGGPGRIKIAIHRRVREGNMFERHPTLEDNIAVIKEYRWPADVIKGLLIPKPNKVPLK